MRPSGPPGSVRLAGDPDAPPEIELGPLSGRRDVAALETGVHLARDLLGSTPFRDIVREVYVDDHGTRLAQLGDDRLTAWIETAGTYLHATSTCAMGRVSGPDGAVVGHEALYVCDASVFPSVPHVNPHLPTVMLAERLAARWATAV
jgi:choline dehydrogenase-like flavoprotein